ncbi:MAG: beta-carotene hydroxylase [Alcanivorax sp.]|jgi:beta-carotene hydroxylase
MNQPDKLDLEAISHSKRYVGKFAWLTVFYGIAVCGSYLTIVALAMLGKLPLLMAFPLVAMLTYLTYTLLHEAAHGSISGSRQSLRWVNEALGYMAAWILMIPLTAHRHEHLAHHRHTNEPGGDPDYVVSELGDSIQQALRVPFGILAGQWTYYRHHRWTKAPPRQNLYLCLEIVMAIVPRLALIMSGLWFEGLMLFILAWWLGLMITLYLFAYLVHRPHNMVGRYVDTSTIVAPGLVGSVLSMIWVNQNYHSIHHLFPRVPFYQYPALFNDIERIMVAKGAPIYRLTREDPGMKKSNLRLIGLTLLALSSFLGSQGCSDGEDVKNGGAMKPLWGVVLDRSPSGVATDMQMAQMQELGVGYAKFWAYWNEIEPELAAYNVRLGEFGVAGDNRPTDLTRDILSANPEWIEDYAFPERPGSLFHDLVDWSRLDAVVDQLVAVGIAPLPLIGDAPAAPKISGPEGPATIAPQPLNYRAQEYTGIGREAYLAHLELHAAAASRRYTQSPERVTWWNIENELNITYVHLAVGWRVGDAWLEEAFRTEVLAALSRGIKLGSPNARATHNVNACLFDPNWADSLARYAEYLDALGLGCYPNYLSSEPLQSDLLIDAVKTASALGGALGKPVFVLETGYPSGPASGGWDETLQDEYVSSAPVDSMNAGASAHFHFLLNDRDWQIPEGDVTQVEVHWGLVRVDGTYKPSFETFKAVIANYVKPTEPLTP